ncbi:hypothetical protein V223_02005 [Staphylococcus aureus W53395]|nr:hypothetical protein V223_02005 [Staphylococcus aureus W53395]
MTAIFIIQPPIFYDIYYTLHERVFVDKRKKAKLFHEINSKYHRI